MAGSPEGCNTLAYWGFSAQTCLCGSENPLISYGIFRLWEIPVPASASNPSCIAVLCSSPIVRLCFISDYREVAMDGWTKGGIEVVYWSVPSFQHTIYPPKSPSLFSLPLIPFPCCYSQYYLKGFVVTGDTLHQFPADCPCLIGVQAEGKQQNNLHIIYGDI